MNNLGRIKSTTLRFNLSKPEQQTAWEYLQNLEKEKYKSINHAITLAVCDFFERQKHAESDPFFESREREEMFVRRILEAVEQALEKGLPTFLTSYLLNLIGTNLGKTAPPEESHTDNVDWDFIDG